MKKLVVFIFFTFLGFSGFGESYNYYDRGGILGKYTIKNEKDSIFSGFKYELKDDEVIGYYYLSDSIKFIDKISDGKVLSTVYYDRNGKKISETCKSYDDDGNPLCIKLDINDSDREISYKENVFFNYGREKITCSAEQLLDSKIYQRIISDGAFSLSFEPLKLASKSIRTIDNKGIVDNFFEEYSYNQNNGMVYRIFNNEKIQYEKIKTEFETIERTYATNQKIETEKILKMYDDKIHQSMIYKDTKTEIEITLRNPELKFEIKQEKEKNITMITTLDESITIIKDNIFSTLFIENIFEGRSIFYTYRGKQEKLN